MYCYTQDVIGFYMHQFGVDTIGQAELYQRASEPPWFEATVSVPMKYLHGMFILLADNSVPVTCTVEMRHSSYRFLVVTREDLFCAWLVITASC
jgi:hypothetical protein